MKSFNLNFWGTELVLDDHFSIHSNCKKLPFESFPVRISSEFICIFTQGSADIEVDSVKYHMKGGMILSVFPMQIVEQCYGSDDLELMYLRCSPEILNKILFRFPAEFELFLKEYPSYNAPEDIYKKHKMLFETLKEKFDDYDNICRSEIVMSYIRCFYLEIYNNLHHELLEDPEKNIRRKEIIKAFMSLILENYKTNRDVAFYADKLNITPKYLSIASGEITGKSAKKIIDDYILTEIKLLLKSTTKSIQEITEELNFPDQSFLSKYFKKHAGVSPKQYRNN